MYHCMAGQNFVNCVFWRIYKIKRIFVSLDLYQITSLFPKWLIWLVAFLPVHLLFSQPTITNFYPNSALPNQPITILGTNFSDVTEVTFNGTIASFTIKNANNIVAVTPAGVTTGLVSVTSPGGTDMSSNDFILALVSSGSVNNATKISDTQGNSPGIINAGDQFGTGMTSIGDLNQDGVPDLAVGVPNNDDGGTDRGALWILFMQSNGDVLSGQKISNTSGYFGGQLDNGDLFGVSLAEIGDLDGDGVLDLAVSASGDDDGGTGRGSVWILFMNTDGTVKTSTKISDTAGGFTGQLDDSDGLGRSVCKLGDLDNDGVNDIAVGAVNDDDGFTDAGAMWIMFLNSDGSVKASQKISATQSGFSGTLNTNDHLGISCTSLGDLDGDGVSDLAAGLNNNTLKDGVWILFLNQDGTVKNERLIDETEL